MDHEKSRLSVNGRGGEGVGYRQNETISELENEIEELKNRSLRKTLIFKNINIERAHRVQNNSETRNRSNNTPPYLVAKIANWEFSERIKSAFIFKNQNGNSRVFAKSAKIVPLYKKQNKLECNNYRPISLVSNIGKLIEKLLHKRLYSFLDQSKCLFGSQFGFRPHIIQQIML